MDLRDRLRLDVPVGQAGMGGGLAGAQLAAAVAAAGGLGTLGLVPPAELRQSIDFIRDGAPGRAVAVNLLMPFVRRHHVEVCVESRIDVAVVAFGGDRALVQQLKDARIFVIAMVGSERRAREALHWGVDALIAQGGEAGGHLCGEIPALELLPNVLKICGGCPVLLAGGIATAADTRSALEAGASGVIAGTRFLLTHESGAHPEYQRRVLAADKTYRTTLFGLSWPAPHRVVANAATERWCHSDGTVKLVPRLINAPSGVIAKLPDRTIWSVPLPAPTPTAIGRLQTPRLPLFTPLAPMRGMPPSWVDRTALYAGESALRMTEVISAGQALAELAGG
ncbi:MAG: nitronate monooxygenase [Mycobacterium sp.]|jgi:nitronate monooxygenase